MATYTPNYNLGKPESTDQFGNFRQLFNDNMDILDGISGGGSGKIIKNQTLNFVGLVATVSDSDIEADSDFAVYYYNETDAEQAGIEAVSSSGVITFTATTAPLNTIVCDIVIFSASGGGGSSTLSGLSDVHLTLPSEGQVLTYDSVNSEWINADPEKNYFKTFSASETVVGTWTDGKPIYQKTVDCGTLPNATTKQVAHGVSDIDFLVNLSGSAKHTNGIQIPLPYVYGNTRCLQVYINATNIFLIASENMSGYTSSFVTLQYTKTTD